MLTDAPVDVVPENEAIVHCEPAALELWKETHEQSGALGHAFKLLPHGFRDRERAGQGERLP